MNLRITLFPKTFYLMNIPSRTFCQSPKGIKFYGFTYYPRNENFKDSDYEPSKLFLIRRIKSLKNRTFKERNYLAMLNIDGSRRTSGHINIVKNIPSMNSLLWKVKHLVDIKPITWKGELPQDCLGTHLRNTGELVISPKLKITSDQLKASEEIFESNKKPDKAYLKGYLSRKWWNGFTGSA